ncbi:hypothetical protein MP228_002276 [Amoeboaphelidium protococcarum]|nr:hypothetical protein MP228_002276 [Amoeboaphelidium protococcarum]
MQENSNLNKVQDQKIQRHQLSSPMERQANKRQKPVEPDSDEGTSQVSSNADKTSRLDKQKFERKVVLWIPQDIEVSQIKQAIAGVLNGEEKFKATNAQDAVWICKEEVKTYSAIVFTSQENAGQLMKKKVFKFNHSENGNTCFVKDAIKECRYSVDFAVKEFDGTMTTELVTKKLEKMRCKPDYVQYFRGSEYKYLVRSLFADKSKAEICERMFKRGTFHNEPVYKVTKTDLNSKRVPNGKKHDLDTHRKLDKESVEGTQTARVLFPAENAEQPIIKELSPLSSQMQVENQETEEKRANNE